MSAAKVKPVVNLSDVPLEDHGHGEKFAAKLGEVGQALGGPGIGCLYHVVPPGKRAFPFHAHQMQHELFLIVEGTGHYRFGDATYPIRAGDVLAAPAGGAEVAHQIVNDSDKTLKYLGFSTPMKGAEIVEYPDSGKFSTTMRAADGETRLFRFIGRQEAAVGYWDGEDG